MDRLPQRRRVAFTLIEILIVVVILGILSTVVMGLFRNARDDTERAAFITSGRKFVESAQRYHLDTGSWLEDSSSGVLPAGFEPYVIESGWSAGTPIGGVWDSEFNSFGIVSALGVHFDGTGATRDDIYMVSVDTLVDDGDLTSGWFRRLANDRYYFVIED